MRKRIFLSLFMALAAVVAIPIAHADGLYGTITTVSRHFPDRNFNQVNPGLGLEYDVGNWGVALGDYKNSYSKQTVYLVASYTPIHMGDFAFGAFGGPATGYNVPVVGGLLVAYRHANYGFNLMVIPPAAKDGSTVLGLQLVFKFGS